MKPQLLDAFCCAGGAARGYQLAGFQVTGIDINPQPNYAGDTFIQGDAIEFIAKHGGYFDAIHASPPCQHESRMSNCRPGLAETYPNLISPTRDALDEIGAPYVIENVEGSSVRPDITLCGHMFGLKLYRHRLFEANFPMWQPQHPRHVIPASKAGHWRPGTIISVSGHCSPMALAREAMGGIDWMTRDELAESIPPQYSEFIGAQLIEHLSEVAA
jgi:DNA (cytosine-5)-methyltransferase 1